MLLCRVFPYTRRRCVFGENQLRRATQYRADDVKLVNVAQNMFGCNRISVMRPGIPGSLKHSHVLYNERVHLI